MRVLKKIGGVFVVLGVVLGVIYLFLPRQPEIMPYTDRTGQPRDLLVADEYAVVTGTPWATEAAVAMLEKGGNACDAAVAALLALNVTHGEAASFVGVAPVMYYEAQTGRVRSYIGAGRAPQAATIAAFRERGFEQVPDLADTWAQLVPASPDVMIALLTDCGSLSFAEVAAPAIRLAREGFPMHAIMYRNFDLSTIERVGFQFLMPENIRIWLRGQFWRPFYLHERIVLPELAATWEAMAAAEAQALAAGGSRIAGLQAVRDYFYQGPIAEKIVAFHEEEGGLFTAEDLATYQGGWETPLTATYGDYTFYGNGTWSQGMMELLTLQILEGVDLARMGHNSPEYIHTVVQALELAFADREAYVGDSDFVAVPLDVLLSKDYAAQRRAAMTPERAFGGLPAPGEIPGYQPFIPPPYAEEIAPRTLAQALDSDFAVGQDTTQLVIIDREGNALVMTPSDFPKTPMVPGTGINLGNRMVQFYLDPASPDALAPGKRPRITPHAVIVFKDGQFWLAYSTPGGDMQSQALVQVFLNMVVFGMDVQEAISAPRFYTISMPSSFAPHEASPGHLRLEADLYAAVADDLSAMGYVVQEDPIWDKDFGAVGAILVGPDGRLYAGADPREETTAAGK